MDAGRESREQMPDRHAIRRPHISVAGNPSQRRCGIQQLGDIMRCGRRRIEDAEEIADSFRQIAEQREIEPIGDRGDGFASSEALRQAIRGGALHGVSER